ncbi:MAG TPA: hypothetical protein PLP01_17440 [Phycisphaerae bacterium]|jgi:hypothetical protein|nr:hypothetical protein [Phycisphaerae bacterium]HOI57039.1 hypothetical protein [Phycisphaerae bacterium]
MRTLVILAVLLVSSVAMVGCGGPKDSHQIYTERMSRRSNMADKRAIVDDFHSSILMDERPSHLTFFINE